MIHLQPTPDQRVTTIQIGTVVRKPAAIVDAYLHALSRQELPPQTEVVYHFIDDGSPPETRALLDAFVEKHGGIVETWEGGGQPDFSDTGRTHEWTVTAMERVGQAKDRLIECALLAKVDYLWFVDADLICDTTTLRSLLGCRAPIACGVYWTRWVDGQPGMKAAPQVWLAHPYQLNGRGYDEPEFRRKLITRQRIQVWGQGACTLVARDVLTKGVRFAPVPGVSREGMMAGEDRHFCIHAEAKHIPMYADGWPDIFHVYHPADQQLIYQMSDRLLTPHIRRAAIGDLVNLYLEPLEPVPIGPGQIAQMPPYHLRGRLGALPLLPELEEAATETDRGTSRIVSVNFPSDFPDAFLRGRRRLIRLTVIDAKPMGFAPVIDRELLVGVTGAYHDRTTLTAAQQAP